MEKQQKTTSCHGTEDQLRNNRKPNYWLLKKTVVLMCRRVASFVCMFRRCSFSLKKYFKKEIRKKKLETEDNGETTKNLMVLKINGETTEIPITGC